MQEQTAFFFIVNQDSTIGVIRVITENNTTRIAPIAILPEFQSRGLGYSAMGLIEKEYPDSHKWLLDTIKQEADLLHFYEQLGYQLTGQEKHISVDMTIVYLEKQVTCY